MSNARPGCLAAILSLFSRHGSTEDETDEKVVDFPYLVRDDFLSPAEKSIFHILQKVVGDENTVLTKVSLGDIFYVANGNHHRSAWNRINRKHVDFLVCNSLTLTPLCGIELNDSSHQCADRQERDRFVDGVFANAHLPLLHIPVSNAYITADIKNRLDNLILTEKPSLLVLDHVTNGQSEISNFPACPKCGAIMVMRTASKGKNSGNHFWGCPNYPKCTGVIPISSQN